ncbi:hypothetical protein RJ035_002949 [Blastomyces gilchristii]
MAQLAERSLSYTHARKRPKMNLSTLSALLWLREESHPALYRVLAEGLKFVNTTNSNSIAAGDTFKQAKTIMERLSWNPNSVPPPEVKSGGEEEYLEEQLQHDTLYWFNPAKGYRRMDARAWSGIERGTVKL